VDNLREDTKKQNGDLRQLKVMPLTTLPDLHRHPKLREREAHVSRFAV
jgi:hypothetical protein